MFGDFCILDDVLILKCPPFGIRYDRGTALFLSRSIRAPGWPSLMLFCEVFMFNSRGRSSAVGTRPVPFFLCRHTNTSLLIKPNHLHEGVSFGQGPVSGMASQGQLFPWSWRAQPARLGFLIPPDPRATRYPQHLSCGRKGVCF